MITTSLIALSTVTGSGHIHFDYKKNYLLCYLLKPLTILVIILALALQPERGDYGNTLLLGLAFSLLGDCFLMLKNQQFIAGLVSFLIAHIIYCIAFYYQLAAPIAPLTIAYFAIPAMLYYGYLYKGLGKLKLPVLAYIGAIVAMTCLSFNVYLQQQTTFALFGFIGALFFMLSDATLALNKFRLPFKAAQLCILSTYYVAQWCIAYSGFG